MLMLATLNAAPPPIMSGDVVSTAGGILRIKRNGAILFTVDLRPLSVPFNGVVLGSQIKPNQIYWERTMAGQNVALVSVVENQATGTVTFSFSNGENVQYQDWAAVGEVADGVDGGDTALLARNILVGKTYRNSPGGENKVSMVGAQCSVNLLADQPIVIVEPL